MRALPAIAGLAVTALAAGTSAVHAESRIIAWQFDPLEGVLDPSRRAPRFDARESSDRAQQNQRIIDVARMRFDDCRLDRARNGSCTLRFDDMIEDIDGRFTVRRLRHELVDRILDSAEGVDTIETSTAAR